MKSIHRKSMRRDAAVSIIALSAALALGTHAFAATAAATTAAASNDLVELDAVVITASGGDKTKLKTSMSVNSVNQEQINQFTPRSEAEVLRLIPGIQVQDTAGPGGNANIGVRGIPVITGGSEFVQLQEDGLPTVLFGDIQFGNNDYWTRYDTNVARVEAVRGGGASTFASQAPGAVINYISDTGEREGGHIGISSGLGFDEKKIDWGFGAHINDTIRFHIGGFLKDGSGPTHIGYNAEHGYQIKANITKEFEDGKGYFRLNFKRLDDKEPTYSGSPSIASVSGNSITGFKPFPGFDARSGSNQSILNQPFKVLDFNGSVINVPMEGIHSKSTSFGAEIHYNFSSNLTVEDKFRWTDQSGAFRTQFTNFATTASVLGNTLFGIDSNVGSTNPANTLPIGSIVYANGPNQGKLFTGTYLNEGPNIDTNISDLGSVVNDVTVSGKYDVMSGHLSAKAGWFHMNQKIAQNWHVNPEFNELTGHNPAQLDLFTGLNGTGTQLTAAGQAGFNNNWGTCCARAVDLSYTDDAPYFNLDYNLGKFDIDGSLRIDSVKASGSAQSGVAGPNVTVSDNLGSATLSSDVAGGPTEVLSYRVHYTSYSVGALYAFDNNTSFFVRISRGGRFNADRRTLGGNFNADGTLNPQGQTTAVNFVQQQEIGVKRRGEVFGGSYTAELTGFRAQLTDNNYDFTLISKGLSPIISNTYHSYGAEFTGSVHYGHFSLYTTETLISSKIVATGKTPHALAAFTYVVSPTYDMGIGAIGLTLDGQSSTWSDDGNTLRIPGQSYLNGFLKIRPYKGLEIGVNANNLFNTLGYRGSGGVGVGNLFNNSAVLGRTFTGSINYSF